MKDITQIIEKAISQDVLWQQEFLNILEKIQSNGYITFFWDNEENWATIHLEDKIIGYIWKKYPLVFIKSQYSNQIKNILKEEQSVVFIDVDEVTTKTFTIDYEALKDYIDYGLPEDGFSAEDFWFVTIT